MGAARALVDSSQGPELLAGYMTLRRWSCGTDYGYTAAGAQAIRNATGVSDFRSKLVLQELLALRFGERGELSLITPTGKRIKNAREYRFGEWDGVCAYVPDLLIQPGASPLLRLLTAEESPEVRRDALLQLLHVYAHVDYGEFLGVNPDQFVFKRWTGEGMAPIGGDDIELGYQGQVGNLHFWLMRENPDDLRHSFRHVGERIYTPGEDAMSRLWAGHDLLLSIGLICRVALVENGIEPFPLWVFSPAYREALAGTGVAGDLADGMYRLAGNNGLDPDNLIIRHATSEDASRFGTELFYCATTTGQMPTIRTVYAPLFHAPTPLNLEGLAGMGERTAAWVGRLKWEGRRAAA
ncbi:hypothetical protein N799_09845 [Lysobacter arseniciresistens ZS79]|uniref:Uncharacterized protein n=2 Tax=Novilysobacter TaxID=3382699 RepID=A0A0A0EV89_9GAMM|nr:hypothetical protein N799_09845 [Lysobacter arseniciresistens ZS79]